MYTYRVCSVCFFAISGSLGMFLGSSPSPKTAVLSHILCAVLSDRSHFYMLQGPTVAFSCERGTAGGGVCSCGWRVGWGRGCGRSPLQFPSCSLGSRLIQTTLCETGLRTFSARTLTRTASHPCPSQRPCWCHLDGLRVRSGGLFF